MEKSDKIKVSIAAVVLVIALGLLAWYLMSTGGGGGEGPVPPAL